MPTKYGLKWGSDVHPLQIEFWMIQKGRRWLREQGRSLFFHYKEAQKIIWPAHDHHRWSDLTLTAICEEEIVILLGCGDSNKTFSMSRFILTDWWAFPDKTLWLISSTEYRGAELRIWGKIKELFNEARRNHDWLPGHPLDSMHAITTDDIDDDWDMARSLQRGLIVVPNKKGNVNVGLSAFVGVKAPRLRHAGDEVQHMSSGFLDAYANWYGKADFKGVMAGNPLDLSDQLCTAAEPADGGWDNFIDLGTTQTWRSKFYNAKVIALDGRDSPNFDYPNADTDPRFPYLIGPKKLDAVSSTYGKDSWQWFNQCVGKPNRGLAMMRVLTRQICEDHKAMESVIWSTPERTKIYALDPAYGGGDRCVGFPMEFGKSSDGVQVMLVHPPEIVPISLRIKKDAEDQIAEYIKKRSDDLKIPPENIFYDSFGRGTLGYAFAKVFGSQCPVPIDSGSTPTPRPVRFDLFVEEEDGHGGMKKRLKRSDEHYSKRVSEMWFSVREAIEGEQMRGLTMSTITEGCARIYKIVKGNKIEVEPKDEMKERTSKSPDEFDALAIGVDGARQRGFNIRRLSVESQSQKPKKNWLEKEARDLENLRQRHALVGR